MHVKLFLGPISRNFTQMCKRLWRKLLHKCCASGLFSQSFVKSAAGLRNFFSHFDSGRVKQNSSPVSMFSCKRCSLEDLWVLFVPQLT